MLPTCPSCGGTETKMVIYARSRAAGRGKSAISFKYEAYARECKECGQIFRSTRDFERTAESARCAKARAEKEKANALNRQ